MKRRPLFLSIFSATAFAVTIGCKQEPSSSATAATSPPPSSAAVELEVAKKEAREALAATREYAYAQKAEFAEQMRQELTKLNKDLDELSAKLEQSTDAAKADAQVKLRSVREQVNRLNARLDSVKDATESTWDEVKTGVRKGIDEVKESFKQARQWLSDKIAP